MSQSAFFPFPDGDQASQAVWRKGRGPASPLLCRPSCLYVAFAFLQNPSSCTLRTATRGASLWPWRLSETPGMPREY